MSAQYEILSALHLYGPMCINTLHTLTHDKTGQTRIQCFASVSRAKSLKLTDYADRIASITPQGEHWLNQQRQQLPRWRRNP